MLSNMVLKAVRGSLGGVNRKHGTSTCGAMARMPFMRELLMQWVANSRLA
jgi:hypothetical protein